MQDYCSSDAEGWRAGIQDRYSYVRVLLLFRKVDSDQHFHAAVRSLDKCALLYVLNLKPPFAQIVLPVHQALSGVHSIAMTPATSWS